MNLCIETGLSITNLFKVESFELNNGLLDVTFEDSQSLDDAYECVSPRFITFNWKSELKLHITINDATLSSFR